MAMKIEPESRLTEKVGRWRKALADEATGPLVIAKEVMDLSEAWEDYRAEAGGVDCTTWLVTTLRAGLGLPWWAKRARAVEVLGRSAMTRIHHEVAVYVLRSVPDNRKEEVKTALLRGAQAQHWTPLAPAQARRLIATIIGKRSRRKACGRCERLERAMRDAGVVVPE